MAQADKQKRDLRVRHRRKKTEQQKRSRLEAKLVEILSSPALNRGFDTLLTKLEGIEENLASQSRQITDVHGAIYDPDEGLFARIKDAESDQEKHTIELQAWREGIDRDIIRDAEDDRVLKEAVEQHGMAIIELQQHKERVITVVKWFLVALGGGGVSLLFQWLSMIISG